MADRVAEGMRELQAEGLAASLVEHDLGFISEMCETVDAMDRRAIALSGTMG